MDGNNARVPELSNLAGLFDELVGLIGRGNAVGPGHLDRYCPLQLRVKRLPNLSEPARANQLVKPVSSEGAGKFLPSGINNTCPSSVDGIAFQQPIHRLQQSDPLLQLHSQFGAVPA